MSSFVFLNFKIVFKKSLPWLYQTHFGLVGPLQGCRNFIGSHPGTVQRELAWVVPLLGFLSLSELLAQRQVVFIV